MTREEQHENQQKRKQRKLKHTPVILTTTVKELVNTASLEEKRVRRGLRKDREQERERERDLRDGSLEAGEKSVCHGR